MALEGPIAVRDRLLWRNSGTVAQEEPVTVCAVERHKGKRFVRLTNSRGIERWYSEELVREKCRRETVH